MNGHIRTFLLAFLFTALVASLLFLFIGRALIPLSDDIDVLADELLLLFKNDESQLILPNDEAPPPTISNIVTLLLVGLDYRPYDFPDYRESAPSTVGALATHTRVTEADFIAVLCVNTDTKEMTAISIPEDTVLTLGGDETTLKTVYASHGAAYFAELVSSLVGFELDYQLFVNVSDIGRIVELAGNLVLPVSTDMYLENDQYTSTPKSGEATLLLEEGNRYITKNNVVWLLSFDDYRDGGSRAETVLSFANALMARFTTLENLLKIDTLYSAVAASVTTNVTLADVQKHISILLSYASYSLETQNYPGTYSEDRELFYPAVQEALAAYLPYR